MKALTLLLLTALPVVGYSQSAFTNHAHSALQLVIGDYPHRFRNIKGNILNADPQSVDYESTVHIPGALNTVITQYSSSDDKEVYSWKCTVAESENFEEAAQKYRDLFNQVKNSIIKIEGEKPFILSGSFENPTEEKRFTTSAFTLLPSAPGDLKKLRVELSLEFYVTEWKLALLVYDAEEEELVMD